MHAAAHTHVPFPSPLPRAGLFAEQGQLLVDENDPSTLVLNPYAWTNASSMLFMEAPACVGYSYADDISGCTHNDSSQAVDNYAALQVRLASPRLARERGVANRIVGGSGRTSISPTLYHPRTPTHTTPQSFFTGFPEYAPNDFFITGESYAGIYVPTLAKQVVLGNAGGNPKINLKGIAVGNGCVGLTYGQCAFDWGVEINTNVPYFRCVLPGNVLWWGGTTTWSRPSPLALLSCPASQ